MEIFFAFIAFVIFFLAMALGYLIQGKPLKGSCGGVAALMGNESCDFCGGDMKKCADSQIDTPVDNTLAYPANKNTTSKM